MKRAILAAVVASAAAILVSAPAQAQPTTNGLQNLTLTISQGESVVPDRTVTLTCGPTGGTHPRAAAACAIVDQVGGAGLEDMNLDPNAICTLEYNPYTVSVQGNDHFLWIDFVKTYDNPCVLNAHTGAFYQF